MAHSLLFADVHLSEVPVSALADQYALYNTATVIDGDDLARWRFQGFGA